MKPRQAILTIPPLMLLFLLCGCTASTPSAPTQTATPSTVPPTPTFTPSPDPPTMTPTPLTCLSEPGKIKTDVIPDTKPPQEILVYLPPCYDELNTTRYPVLYLLHGQTYKDDQWVRIGAPRVADQLIHSGESVPFMMVFPDDHYWNAPAGGTFGERFINVIIPYVDRNYRTLADRQHRALGGLSRGGGWTVQLGFAHPELFGSLGLHSPAIFQEDAPYIGNIVRKIPEETRPRLWFDIGDADKELGSGRSLEEILTAYNYLHEFHLFAGDHTETYWSAHVDEYLRWYAEAWQADPAGG